MRYKEQTMSKLEAQAMKLKSLQRAIEMSNISGPQAIQLLEQVIKDINIVVDRIALEHNE